jgi:hypothetical protein
MQDHFKAYQDFVASQSKDSASKSPGKSQGIDPDVGAYQIDAEVFNME